jgi:hypothetical protein
MIPGIWRGAITQAEEVIFKQGGRFAVAEDVSFGLLASNYFPLK